MPGKTIRTLSEQLPRFIAKLVPVIRPPTLSAAQTVVFFILRLLAGSPQQVDFPGWTPSVEAGIGDDEATLTEEEVRASTVGQNGERWPRGIWEGCEWS